MKKYLSGLLAVILAISTSAFSVKTDNVNVDPLFHWFVGNEYTGNEDDVEGEGELTDCEGSGDVCEYGYDDAEDFIGGVPENGLAPGAIPDAEIRELP
jgi:hypothetical protein